MMLRQCPFCGGKAETKTYSEHSDISAREAQRSGLGISGGTLSWHFKTIYCTNCPAEMRYREDLFSAEDWNRRV